MPAIAPFFHRLANWFRFDAKPAPTISFAQCYKAFRALLTANNHALELMAEMEQALAAGRPFGMAFVRGTCTALSVNVYKMILHLQEMADGKYADLGDSFKTITNGMEEILGNRPLSPRGEWLLPMAAVDRQLVDMVGEKMANLGEIRNRVGLNTPEGFVITAAACTYFMAATNLQDEINRRLKTMDEEDLEELYQTSSAVQQLIINADLPQELAQAIMAQHLQLQEALGRELLVSMRSSALGEDSGSVSFAGQYRTQLNVGAEFILQTYKEIVAGKYKSQAIVYRMQRGFRHQDVIMCVGCLVMVDAVVSGVTYSRSPTNRRSDWVEITAVAGLANQVVDGNVGTDSFRVSREAPQAIIHKHIRPAASADDGGVNPVVTLNDDQAAELARVAIRLEQHFGEAQDIEWSIDRQGRIIILQSRPLGVTAAKAVDGPLPEDPPADDALVVGGMTVSHGVASGPVCIVRSTVDLLQFPKGAVLVVAHPVPEWATLLSRAVAVISETGQAAAHLATVAREFGVPAIFGVPGATRRLTAQEVVTVDATACRVYQGHRPDILAHGADQPPNLMVDSPIFKLLKQVLALVAPLNLTDPGSLYFTPSACRTLHDLTRFCHEKAVAEMFSYGSQHGFDDKSAKQLVGDMPYQWWVIDLDDGFAPGFDKRERFIPIDAIVSQPMLAIWAGMTAIPWEGPPPISLSGFGSILFRSTMNRHLEPSVRSNLSERNYFMVSKNFCNVCVRLGYHFSLVEAHLSEFLTENYISFQFKGGAADEERRYIRIQLIREILSRYGFRVEQKADALVARIEKRPAPYLLVRLKVLGYLLMHTRQIDMVMGDQGMVDHYRQKISADLQSIVPECERTEEES
jgi:pyruvate,water dikinase